MVIVIIGVLAAFVVPNFFNAGENARIDLTKALISSGVNGTLERFRLDMGRYPTTEEGLQVLVTKPSNEEDASKWRGPYLNDANQLKDSWKRELIYQAPGQYNSEGYDLSSPGPDGQTNTADDITNWQKTG
jgi:general secretion pathway protein G